MSFTPRIGYLPGTLIRQVSASVSEADLEEAIAQWQQNPPDISEIKALDGVDVAAILSSDVEGDDG